MSLGESFFANESVPDFFRLVRPDLVFDDKILDR